MPPPFSPIKSLTHLADLIPPSQERAWLTAPHPRLPIVATCCADKSIRIYSLVNFTLLSTITGGHKRSVRSCAWKPHVKGESVLATASFDATVGIWRRWDGYGRAERDMLGLSGGTAAADREMSGNVHVDGKEGREDEEDEDEEWGFAVLLDGHDSEVKSVAWSPGGSLLATCSRDKSIWIWEDLEDGDNNYETVAVLQEHSGDVKYVSWHPEEECLASASYDDTIRLWREDVDDWGQIACLRAHEGTVWCVEWEGATSLSDQDDKAVSVTVPLDPENGQITTSQRKEWLEQRSRSGPRLVSCSDDRTIRIWRKQPQEKQPASRHSSIPSIIRPASIDETWVEECQLPAQHELAIYSVAWSKKTGLIASTGADGRIVIYQERFTLPFKSDSEPDLDSQIGSESQTTDGEASCPSTKWEVVACVEAAHGIYEVNHICWAKRADEKGSRRQISGNRPEIDSVDVEEILLSTGDDGAVKIWRFE